MAEAGAWESSAEKDTYCLSMKTSPQHQVKKLAIATNPSAVGHKVRFRRVPGTWFSETACLDRTRWRMINKISNILP